MQYKISNNATATLAASITAASTSITVTTGQGALFPSLLAGETFPATLVDSANNLEIVRVTGRVGDTLTVLRGQEGTSARAWVGGDILELRVTANVFNSYAQTAADQTFSGDNTFSGTNAFSGATTLSGANTLSGATTVSGAASFTNTVGFSVSPTVPTAPFGDSSGKAASTQFVTANAVLPGSIIIWPGPYGLPSGYMLCNGQAVSRTTYAALFAAIGDFYGPGDGTTTFNLPNLGGRMPMGSGGVYTVGGTGGTKDAVIVAHSHAVIDPGHAHTVTATANGGGFSGVYPGASGGSTVVTSNTGSSSTGITINSTGVNGTDMNLPPFMVLNFVIKF